MKCVAIVAPFYLENTLRYVRALGELPIKVGVISHRTLEELPADLRRRVQGHYRIDDCMDPRQLAVAARGVARQMGQLDGLLGVLEQLQVPLAIARQEVGIPGMWAETGRAFRDKTRMKDIFRAEGLPCARHRRIESVDQARAFAEWVGYPLILKPVDGLGSKSTYRIRSESELLEVATALSPSPTSPLQAEEFVRGTEWTLETVSIRGQAVWHSGTRYLPGPLEVLENPWIQYCVLLPREDGVEHRAFQPVGERALKALGMQTGLSHMEWFMRPDGSPVISEVGARPPGVMIMPLMSWATDTDMIRAWTRLMVLEEWRSPVRRYAAGCAFFRAQGNGDKVLGIAGVQAAQEEVGPLVVEHHLPKPGTPRAAGYEGEGWAIIRHESTAVVRHALQRLVELVRIMC
jgi:biotin carboxylase